MILKAQCILFKRYSDVLHPFKYAGYPMLLDAVNIADDMSGTSEHFLSAQKYPQLKVLYVNINVNLIEKRNRLLWNYVG